MGKALNREFNLLPKDHPLFNQGASIVGVRKSTPSTSDTKTATAGEPQTPTTTEPKDKPE